MSTVCDSAFDVLFGRELIWDLWPELSRLLVENHDETGMLPGAVLDPDKDKYGVLEKAGCLRCFTARVPGVGLVGYSVFVVSRSLHSKNSLQAVQDAMFVAPGHRYGSLGLRLVRFGDDALTAEGVEFVVRQSANSRDITRIFLRMGYTETHRCYARRLNDGN